MTSQAAFGLLAERCRSFMLYLAAWYRRIPSAWSGPASCGAERLCLTTRAAGPVDPATVRSTPIRPGLQEMPGKAEWWFKGTSAALLGFLGSKCPERTSDRPVNWEVGTRSCAGCRVVLDSFFRDDSTLTRMTIQFTQLRLNSNPKFANLTQLRLNSKPNFTNLTQFWLNSFESELSEIWLTTHHILPNLANSCWPGGGVRSNAAVGCRFILCKATDQCKILTFFFFRKIRDSTLT